MEAVASFMSVKRSEGEVASPLLTTTPGVEHAGLLLITAYSRQHMLTTCFAGDGGYWTVVGEVWHARCSGLHLSPHSWILLRWRSTTFITADSNAIWSTWIGHGLIPIR